MKINNYDCFIVDASNMAYRCWWGVKDLKYNNIHTGLEFGFIRQIISYIKNISPQKIYLAWDGEPLRCKTLLPEYKQGRVKVNSDEPSWGPRLKRLRSVFSGICNNLYHEHEEADEQIAKFIKLNPNKKCLIISNDKDLHQFINENVHVEYSGAIIDNDLCVKIWGFPAYKIPLFKSLDTDKSDNIKGVQRLATKTKIKLVKMSENINDLINNFNGDFLTEMEKKKLNDFKQQLLKNYEIVNLLGLNGEYNLTVPCGNDDELCNIIKEMNFGSINYDRKFLGRS